MPARSASEDDRSLPPSIPARKLIIDPATVLACASGECDKESVMAVNGVGSTGSNTDLPTVDADKQGFAGLTSEDFVKLLITQLQNQDPSNPLDSDQLLNQISQMRSLQAGIELQDTLELLTTSQQLTSSTAFIGKRITGLGTDDTSVSGTVSKVQLRDGTAYLTVGSKEVKLADVLTVAE
jgi:flagellar basal-body rod modification protein FlgD